MSAAVHREYTTILYHPLKGEYSSILLCGGEYQYTRDILVTYCHTCRNQTLNQNQERNFIRREGLP